jgi:hypothetical protein
MLMAVLTKVKFHNSKLDHLHVITTQLELAPSYQARHNYVLIHGILIYINYYLVTQ